MWEVLAEVLEPDQMEALSKLPPVDRREFEELLLREMTHLARGRLRDAVAI